MHYLTATISLVNLALSVILLSICAKIYRSSKAIFAVSLIFFAGLLMLHNIIAIYAYFAMASLYVFEELITFFIVIHIAELVGLLVLLKVTL